MKKAFLSILCLLNLTPAFAQRYEFSVHIISGLFNYHGSGANSESFIDKASNGIGSNYVNNPYGTKPTYSYGVAVQVQCVTPVRLLWGMQAGYENLRSSVDLYQDNHLPYTFYTVPPTVAGYNILSSDVFNFNPFLGYRIKLKQVSVDAVIGLDVAVGFSTHQKGQTKADDGSTDYVDLSWGKELDPTYRFELKASYRRYGISTGYNYGVFNYNGRSLGASSQVFSRMMRMGISYKIR